MRNEFSDWLLLIGLLLALGFWVWSWWRGTQPQQSEKPSSPPTGPTMMDYCRKRAAYADMRRACAGSADQARAEAQERADARSGAAMRAKADERDRRVARERTEEQARRKSQMEARARKKARAEAEDRSARDAQARRDAWAEVEKRERARAEFRARGGARGRGGEGEIDFSALQKHSPINLLGYRVGASSPLLPRERRAILVSAVRDHLPIAYDPGYLEVWGTPDTRRRFERIQGHLRFLLKSQGAHPRRRQAAADWAADIAWLTAEFGSRFAR